MSLQPFFPIITSTTIAITTTFLGCTIAQAVTLNGGQKLQAISTLAYSQNVFFLGGFAENNSSALNSSNVTFTPESLIFNSSTQLGDSLFTSTYNSTYDSNTDTVTWNQLGVLGSQSWSSSGTVSFLDDNETIVWNSNGSINPEWEVFLQLGWNGEGWTGGISGTISDNLGEYGSYNANVGIAYDGNFWKRYIYFYRRYNWVNYAILCRSSRTFNYLRLRTRFRIWSILQKRVFQKAKESKKLREPKSLTCLIFYKQKQSSPPQRMF